MCVCVCVCVCVSVGVSVKEKLHGGKSVRTIYNMYMLVNECV